MDSKRQQKFSRQIQKDLSEIFQRDAKHLFDGAFITVTEVKVSPDLGLAKVYLSFMLAKNKELLMDEIESKNKAIRHLLGNKLRHQARIIPELRFYLDETADYAAKMDALIGDLVIPPLPESEKEAAKKNEAGDKE